MLTAADGGRAQFVGISIETFAIRSATSVENEEKKNDEMFELFFVQIVTNCNEICIDVFVSTNKNQWAKR